MLQLYTICRAAAYASRSENVAEGRGHCRDFIKSNIFNQSKFKRSPLHTHTIHTQNVLRPTQNVRYH